MTNTQLWLLFFVIGLGTFLVRLSFIQLQDNANAFTQRAKHVLTIMPPAILAALCIPAILFDQKLAPPFFSYHQIAAAIVTVLIAKYSNSVFWPVVAGMACLLLLRYIAGD
jgi:branched-subunit amino acid transport protein